VLQSHTLKEMEALAIALGEKPKDEFVQVRIAVCLQCVCSVFVVWCSVVQCGVVWCSVVQCIAVCCNVLQCVAVCCSVLQRGAVWCSVV